MGRVQWSDLPKELLASIAKRLDTDIEIVRFRSVCMSWRSSIPPRYKNPTPCLPLQLPVWISPKDFNNRDLPGYFNLIERTIYKLEEVNKTPTFSVIQKATSSSSSSSSSKSTGWLVKIQEAKPGKTRLLNLLTNCSDYHLHETFPKVLNLSNFRISVISKAYYIEYVCTENITLAFCGDYYSLEADKVVLVSNIACTSVGDYAIMALHSGGKLGFLRAGDKKWTDLGDGWTRYDDIINYEDQFCVVNYNGKAVAFDLSLKASEIATSLSVSGDKKNLVLSFGDLLLVDRYLKDVVVDTVPCTIAVQFKVYKLNKEMRKWDEMKSLGDIALFVGDDCSFSVPARDFPGCKGNCIFYREGCFAKYNRDVVDAFRGFLSHDIGVFNLENRTLCPLQYDPGLCSIFWPPPNLARA